MTTRQSLFYKRIDRKLPALLRRLIPQDHQERVREYALAIIENLPVGAERVVPALQKALPECDYHSTSFIFRALLNIAERNNSGLREVAKVIPDMRQVLERMHDDAGFVKAFIEMIEALIQGQDQIESWVPLGTSLENAAQIMEAHHCACWRMTNDPSRDFAPGIFLKCNPGNLFYPKGTNQNPEIYFLLSCASNKVSTINVKLKVE